MLLINYHKLDVGIAIRDESHELHDYAVEYTKGIAELREKFGKVVKFVRPGFPRFNKGADSKGNEVRMVEPPIPMTLPLEREFSHPLRGKEIWSCCLQMPKLQPNGILWSMGNKRSIRIDEFLNVDIDKQPDLAFYLYYISRFGVTENDARLKVDDPKKEIREKAKKREAEVERQTAIWQMLKDEDALRKIAAAYGVPNAATKEPDLLRFDLEAQLEMNDKKKRNDMTIRGTREFLDEMKVTDSVRLRAFLQKLIDDKKFVCKPDGRLRLGDKLIAQVPYEKINDKNSFIWDYFATNKEKLQELMRDVVNKEYLDGVTDPKDYKWIAKCMGIETNFKNQKEIEDAVYNIFAIV